MHGPWLIAWIQLVSSRQLGVLRAILLYVPQSVWSPIADVGSKVPFRYAPKNMQMLSSVVAVVLHYTK